MQKYRKYVITYLTKIFFQYATLLKATGSDSADIPGYVYEELIQISFENENLATQLAIYLADCLDSNSFKIKPAKCLHHLVRKGSRQFRSTLRNQKDDVLRKFASSSDPLVAKLCQELRNLLFDENLMNQDASETEEQRPNFALSGMGATSGYVFFQ